MQDVEFDFVTSLMVDPSQLLGVTDIQPGMLESRELRAIYHYITKKNGAFTRALIHDDLESTWAYFVDGFKTDTKGVVDAFFQAGVTAGNAQLLGERIRERSLHRWIQEVTGQTKADQFNSAEDWASALVSKIQDAVARSGSASTHSGLSLGVDEFLQGWEFRLQNPDKITGIRVNMGKLDELSGGLKAGEFIIWAGHSGEGKSQVIVHQAAQAAQTLHDLTGKPNKVAIVSLEMNRKQLAERFVAHLARVSLNGKTPSATDITKVRDAAAKVKQMCDDRQLIIIEPSEAYTLDQICRETTRLKQQDDISMVCIDYAQLIDAKGESKYAQMSTISQRLKQTAMQLDIPVICGAQFNREALKDSKSARPALYHIADGMDLARSADLVYAIWTPAKHLQGAEAGSWAGIAVVLTLKRRSGAPIDEQYFYAEYQYSHLQPVEPAKRNQLMGAAAQKALYGTRGRINEKP